jgi:hypothetical protein
MVSSIDEHSSNDNDSENPAFKGATSSVELSSMDPSLASLPPSPFNNSFLFLFQSISFS